MNLDRSGAGDLDISFRIDDFTIVRAKNSVTVRVKGSNERGGETIDLSITCN